MILKNLFIILIMISLFFLVSGCVKKITEIVYDDITGIYITKNKINDRYRFLNIFNGGRYETNLFDENLTTYGTYTIDFKNKTISFTDVIKGTIQCKIQYDNNEIKINIGDLIYKLEKEIV